ncbi:MAG TPA: hypothetical protein VFE78_34510 [Gemmataceae bacterium]|nr:hypothetical protein [Gemmataceae bacterium]
MGTMLRHFIQDECGAVVAGEWVFVVTILALGAVTGAVLARQAALAEAEGAPAAVSR